MIEGDERDHLGTQKLSLVPLCSDWAVALTSSTYQQLPQPICALVHPACMWVEDPKKTTSILKQVRHPCNAAIPVYV